MYLRLRTLVIALGALLLAVQNASAVLTYLGSTRSDGWKVVKFTASTDPLTDFWTVPAGVTSLEVLVVGGGGAGGAQYGGGGGAGGVVYYGAQTVTNYLLTPQSSFSVTPGQSIAVTVGAGAPQNNVSAQGATGSSSIFGTVTAYGGQGGWSNNVGGSIGKGGAAGWNGTSNVQGYLGGNDNNYSSGGGAGQAGSGTGPGGNGLQIGITGTLTYYGGGGGALLSAGNTTNLGGLGGGGNGAAGSNGATKPTAGGINTGGGGGAGWAGYGAAGGSGVVIVAYYLPPSYIWNGGGGETNNWQNTANWVSAVTGSGTETLRFGPITDPTTFQKTPNNDFPLGTGFAGIEFDADAPAYTLVGNGIALSGLIFNKSSNHQVVNLPIALSQVIDVNTGNGGMNVTLGQEISGGSGGIAKSGSGTLILSGVNTYGGSTTISAGTLQVDGSIGSGPAVTLPATTTLAISAGGTVSRDVTVSGGAVSLAGTMATGTTLKLTSGTISTVAGGTAQVATADFSAAGASDGVDASAKPLAITSTLKLPGGYVAALSGGGSQFTATGSNIANNDASRTLTLSGGKLTLGRGVSTIGSGPTLWLDASDANTLFTDTAGTTGVTANSDPVARWNSKTGGYSLQQATAVNQPTYATNQAQGHAIVDFGPFGTPGGTPGTYDYLSLRDSNGNPVELNLGNTQNTIFWIAKGMNSLLTDSTSYNFIRGSDWNATGPIWSSGDAAPSVTGGTTYLNKAQVNGTSTGLTGNYDLVDLITTGTGNAFFNTLANERNYRVGGMQYGEILIFPGALSSADRQAVENYLYGKWISGSGTAGQVNLPNTSIAVASNSELDLGSATSSTLGNLTLSAGTTLTLQNSGAGVSFKDVAGSGATRINAPAPLTVRNALAPAGQMTVNGDLILASAATTTLNIDASGVYDWISVNGNALTLDGTLNVTLSGTFTSGGTYDLFRGMDTTWSQILGTFAFDPTAAPEGYAWHVFDGGQKYYYDTAAGTVSVRLDSTTPVGPKTSSWTSATESGWAAGTWSEGVPAAGDTALFSTGAQTTVELRGATPSLGGLTFDSTTNSYRIFQGEGGGSLTLAKTGGATITDTAGNHEIAAPVILGSATSVDVADTYDLTISGAVTGDNGLTKTGLGTLTLSSPDNNYAGTTVSGGTLVIASAGALPAGKSLSIGSGGTLILGGGMAMGQAAAEPVPEPGTLALLAIAGLAGVMTWRRRSTTSIREIS